jgi:transposase
MAKGKRFASTDKFNAAIAVISSKKSAVEAAKELGCHPSMVTLWKKEVEEHGARIFESLSETSETNQKIAKLERTIGVLALENGFLERVLGRSA